MKIDGGAFAEKLDSKAVPDGFGLPGWAWPAIGLVAGLALVVVVHGTCFVDPDCD